VNVRLKFLSQIHKQCHAEFVSKNFETQSHTIARKCESVIRATINGIGNGEI